MPIRNLPIARFRRQAVATFFAIVPPAAASAGEAPSDDYYVGGLVGVGAARSLDRGIFPNPAFMYGLGFEPPISAQSGDEAPSLSLIFGKNHLVLDEFSVGFEFEGEYQGARATSSGSFLATYGPTARLTVTNFLQSSTDWSVPAQAALRARASFLVAPGLSLYGSVGPTLGYARFLATITANQIAFGLEPPTYRPFYTNAIYSAGADKAVVDLGISLNAGMEIAVAPNIGLRGEYSLAVFQTIIQRGPLGLATARATPVFQGARLGIVKHF